MTKVLPATIIAQIRIPTRLLSRDVTKVLPHSVGVETAILISKSVDFSNRVTTKVLPASAAAQISILISKRVKLTGRSVTLENTMKICH